MSREVFEESVRARLPDADLRRAEDGEYLFCSVQISWEGWQARQPEIDALKAAIASIEEARGAAITKWWAEIQALKAEVERLRKLYDDAMCDCPKHQMKEPK